MSWKIAAMGCLALLAFAAVRAQPSDAELKKAVNELMLSTQIVAVNDVTSPESFVPDNDPNTLQVVYIADPAAGKNRISEDGEVIFFFGDVSVNTQQPYIFKAFEFRAKRRMAKP